MDLTIPEKMEDLVYWTNRKIDSGEIKLWVNKEDCVRCGKSLMGKPVDSKTGKVKIRAKEYVCAVCGHSVEKGSYEETLTACCIYTCPFCEFKGSIIFPFKRKKYQGVSALVFSCEKCNEKIPVTKKLKSLKKK